MDAKKLNDEIKLFCENNANDENVKRYQRFFKVPINSHGLTTQQIYSQVKIFSKNKDITLELVLETLDEKLIYGKYEEISIGILLVEHFRKQYTPVILLQIAKLFSRGIDNWAHADILATMILYHFLTLDVVNMSEFKSWLSSQYKFQRRCVPVTFIKVIKKNRNVSAYIDFIRPLMHDKDREVHQGVGWFLREAWKIEPDIVEQFLLEYKDISARLIFQYACEKMTPDQKLKFKSQKK